MEETDDRDSMEAGGRTDDDEAALVEEGGHAVADDEDVAAAPAALDDPPGGFLPPDDDAIVEVTSDGDDADMPDSAGGVHGTPASPALNRRDNTIDESQANFLRGERLSAGHREPQDRKTNACPHSDSDAATLWVPRCLRTAPSTRARKCNTRCLVGGALAP